MNWKKYIGKKIRIQVVNKKDLLKVGKIIDVCNGFMIIEFPKYIFGCNLSIIKKMQLEK